MEKIKNIKSKYYTISDFAKITGLSRFGIYYKIENNLLQKDRDYKVLSNNGIVIIINQHTKALIGHKYKEEMGLV